MNQAALTIHEAAARLGVCASTLRTWGEKTGVAGTRTGSGKRLYTDADMQALEAVKELRDQDAGWATIRRKVGRETPPGEPILTSTPLMPEAELGEAGAVAMPSAESNVLVTKVIETLNAQSGMAERYARAGYQIGRLEAEVKNLMGERERMAAKLAEAERRLAEMSLNEELLRAERAKLGRELGEARQKMAVAEIEPSGGGLWGGISSFFAKWW